MSQTRPNKIVTITNDEVYDLATHQARMADSATVVIRVSSAAERDALALPAGWWVSRTDRNGDLEGSLGGGVYRTAEETILPTVSDPLWAFTGQLKRSCGTDGKYTVALAERMARVSGSFTLTTTYITLIAGFIPVNWRPAVMFNGWALLTAADDNPLATIWFRITPAGDLQARLDSGSISVVAGLRFALSGNWTTS
jgi:hypothetical protein